MAPDPSEKFPIGKGYRGAVSGCFVDRAAVVVVRKRMFRAVSMVSALLIAGSACAHDHLEARLFVIRSQLAQAGPAPVVFGGDSITEAALLPAEVCGHRVVNAGIGGATAYQYALAVRRLDFKAAAFVLAIGTNDAEPGNVAEFPDRYRFLSKAVTARSGAVLYAGIPPIEAGTIAEQFDPKSSDEINQAIRDYAGRQFIDTRTPLAKLSQKTIDGVHLSPPAQAIWLETILPRLKAALGC
ncbi:SGNH/GDSL hydrolase family protein [Bradyrhizobium sp. USDA 4452]